MKRIKGGFQRLLRRYGQEVTLVHHTLKERDQRGQPVYEDDTRPLKAFFHVNRGGERIIKGQRISDYDAYVLIPLGVSIMRGDHILIGEDKYTVTSIIKNRTHIEATLQRIADT